MNNRRSKVALTLMSVMLLLVLALGPAAAGSPARVIERGEMAKLFGYEFLGNPVVGGGSGT